MRTFALVTALFFWFVATSEDVLAQQEVSESEQKTSPIEVLGSEYQNSIKLLQNRFRIDHNVEEVTLVFFREYGSAPVVLVRPDGSKIFQSHAENDDPENAKVLWYDDTTYDMVKIRDPVPGPWQAVGQILPGSRVMVVSDIQLHAEPLPEVLFAGEILKQTAYLTNDNKPIQYNEFRDAVELTIELISTRNPNYDNFNAQSQLVATFMDNGKGMDEIPLDGTFTGQFNLSITPGEWSPVFRVSTPMYTREQVGSPLVLHANPVVQNVEYDDGERGYHTLLIDVNRELVAMESLLVDGEIRFPNGDVQNFSLTEPSDKVRRQRIIAFEDGLFKVKLTAYGRTVTGRDFILDVPEYSFVAEPPDTTATEAVPVEPAVTEPAVAKPAEAAIPPPLKAPQPEEPEMDSNTLMRLLLAVNGTILLVGTLVIGGLVWRRKSALRTVAPVMAENSEKPEPVKPRSRKWSDKINGFFKKKPKSKTVSKKPDSE